MRQSTKPIMLLTAAAFVALMVFEWGMDLSGQSAAQASGGELGRINGEPVSYEAYFRIYQNLYSQQQEAQESPITSVQNRQIEEAAWEQLLMETLIQQEIARRGITANDEEILQAARYAPPPEFFENEAFQTDGRFDIQKYHQFLGSPAVDRQLLLQLEAYYRDMIPRTKLIRQVSSGVYVPEGELWRMWRDRTEQVRARYIALDPQRVVPDASAPVSPSEIEAYYRAHEEEFERPARAEIRFVALDRAPTQADTLAALEKARAVRQEILGGADFAEVARRESADPGSAAQGGSLGTFQRGQMVPAFDQAVFSQPLGEVGEPVQTQFGYHVIQVESREGDQATARHILIPIELGPASEDALLERADQLEDLGERLSLDEAAEQLGLSVRTAEITSEMAIAPGIGPIEEGADWAFEDAAPGEVSPVFDTDRSYYMLELVERQPERTLSLSEATPLIRSRLVAEKKLEKAKQVGRELVDQIRRGQTLDQAAAARGLEVRETDLFARVDFVPGLGQANAAIGTAFGLEPGKVSGAVESDGAVYIIQTVEHVAPDSAAWEQQKQLQRARVMAALEQERWQQFLVSLRERADIKDFREQVLRASAEDEEP